MRGNSLKDYKQFAELLNNQAQDLKTIRGLFRLRTAKEMGREPIAIEEVEPRDWAEMVYNPEIVGKPEQLYKKPGYGPADLP